METFLDSLGLKLTTRQDCRFIDWFRNDLLSKEVEIYSLQRRILAKVVGVIEYANKSGFVVELFFDNAIRQINMGAFLQALSEGDIRVL